MLTLAIQAGGLSRRMGQDKGIVHLNGIPLIEHVLNRLDDIADETIITSNHPEKYQFLNLPIAADKEPGSGALAGLQTALQAANGEYVFVVACDMPLVNRQLVEFIISQADDADLVIPIFNDRFQPFHALYHRNNCLRAIEQSIIDNQKRMISIHANLKVREIQSTEFQDLDPLGDSFININDPQELAQLETKLAAYTR
jgi:molybdopterin-guanine dinucleotide biosynthesis protein A